MALKAADRHQNTIWLYIINYFYCDSVDFSSKVEMYNT